MRPQTIFVSATPAPFELAKTDGTVTEQIIRPTGLVDPEIIIRPCTNQVDDVIGECKKVIEKGFRVLITTLTKKTAEDLSEYMNELKMKVTYLHSDVDTMERVETIRALREGEVDILIGINLLREGLDIPECGLVAILDADKTGFLRSATALTQTIGRAARNLDGYVILYADVMTEAIKFAVSETERRRKIQVDYNKKHGITPKTIKKAISMAIKDERLTEDDEPEDIRIIPIDVLRKQMLSAASNLEFEEAARLRDIINNRQNKELFA